MGRVWCIKREEWAAAAVALLVFVAENILMIGKYYSLFTRGGRVAFWSIFSGHFTVSGFDSYIYLILSHWKVYYTLYRHPLLPLFLWPFAKLNKWLMTTYEHNFAVYIVGALLVVSSLYAFVFLYRILRELVGLRRWDATLLSALFFSFAGIMLTSVVPDHFCYSMTLILLTLYLAGRHLKSGTPMPGWQTGLLFFFTSGITLTNGLFVLLAAFFCNGGRRFFQWRHLVPAFVLPLLLVVAGYLFLDITVVRPDTRVQQARIEKRMKTDARFAQRVRAHEAWMKTRTSSNNTYTQWIDLRTSRWDTAVENLFGETIQLHTDYLLQDTNRTRPIIVRYRHAYNYVVEAVLLLLFAAGCWAGRRERFFQLVMAWFLFNMVLHIGIGFALTEVYIMGAHWLFALPIAVGYLLGIRGEGRGRVTRNGLRLLIAGLTLYLWIYNGSLFYQYMQITIGR
ncbi:MAG: hypothetical protein IJ710_07445 [Prevotella sp.]|nr:hypothetical protein [Prevotella sp.]